MNRLQMRRGDIVVLVLSAVAIVACCVLIWWPRAGGDTVIVQTPAGEQRYRLSEDRTVTVIGEGDIVLTVEISGGQVRVKDSGCPDHVCVHSGWLSKSGQAAACVPAGVSVRVVGTSAQVDGVTA